MQDEKYRSISYQNTTAQKSFIKELSMESENVNKRNNTNLKINRSTVAISQKNVFSHHKRNKDILTYKISEGQIQGFYFSAPFLLNR